jgi:hypothetical protein
MAASSSKTLQIARKMDGTGNPKKSHNGKQNPQTIPDPLFISDLR